jgi:hypothetical protein
MTENSSSVAVPYLAMRIARSCLGCCGLVVGAVFGLAGPAGLVDGLGRSVSGLTRMLSGLVGLVCGLASGTAGLRSAGAGGAPVRAGLASGIVPLRRLAYRGCLGGRLPSHLVRTV